MKKTYFGNVQKRQNSQEWPFHYYIKNGNAEDVLGTIDLMCTKEVLRVLLNNPQPKQLKQPHQDRMVQSKFYNMAQCVCQPITYWLPGC